MSICQGAFSKHCGWAPCQNECPSLRMSPEDGLFGRFSLFSLLGPRTEAPSTLTPQWLLLDPGLGRRWAHRPFWKEARLPQRSRCWPPPPVVLDVISRGGAWPGEQQTLDTRNAKRGNIYLTRSESQVTIGGASRTSWGFFALVVQRRRSFFWS